MEKIRVNLVNSLVNHPRFNKRERDLGERLSFLNPNIAEYVCKAELMENNPTRIYFKLKEKVNSKEEFEKKFISEKIIEKNGEIKVGETLELLPYGKFYFLSHKEIGSELVIYFTNPGQEQFYEDYLQ